MAGNTKWTGRWAGGRIREGERGRVFWLDKMVEGKRYTIRLAGIRSEAQAVEELRIFRANPEAYTPPAVRHELEMLEEEEQELERIEADREASRLVMTDAWLDAFHAAQVAGYGAKAPVSDHHARVCDSFLRAWASHPAIEGRDIRTVKLREWREALETGVGIVAVAGGTKLRPWASHKHRIVALRSYTAWLRWKGELDRAEDTTLDLSVPQAHKPSPKEKAARVYTVEELERTYAAIEYRPVRDLFWLRVHTGLHESEIARIAQGEGIVERLPAGGPIAAVVEVRHKSGRLHRQSVDADTLARIDRLGLRKRLGRRTWLEEATLARARVAAAKASGCREVYIGHLRHTRTTLLERMGRKVLPVGDDQGVPLTEVARSHGHSADTARDHYSGISVPPMLVVPVTLTHPGDAEPDDVLRLPRAAGRGQPQSEAKAASAGAGEKVPRRKASAPSRTPRGSRS